MATPRRLHTSIGFVAWFAICACGKAAEKPIRHDAGVVVAPAVDAAAVAAPTDSGTSAGKITITFKKPNAPGTGLAKRCAIGGPPLTTDCGGGSKGIAFDKAGTLYLPNGNLLHRYQVTPGDPCKLDPAGDPLELPPENSRPQVLGKGPIYMRSGGVAWQMVTAGDAVYVHDFLVGLFRVDRGKVEPACTTEFGFRSIVKVGKRLLAHRNGIEAITPGATCKVKSAGIDDKLRDDVFAAHDQLYAGFSKLVRYDGKTATELAPDARFCAITAMAACGDGACVIDHNCPKIVQLAADGTLVREIEADKLFDQRPWTFDGAALAGDGTLYLYARHRDTIDGKESCEAAVYAVPAAVFER